MLKWLRLRKRTEDVHRVAIRPLLLLRAHEPDVFPAVWETPYCCTLAYFWTAVVAEDVCGRSVENDDKFRTLREAFTRIVEETDGVAHDVMRRVLPDGHPIRRRALVDLKRAVDLYNGQVNDRYMIYPEYREAVYNDGRPAPAGNAWGIEQELSYEILLSSYISGNTFSHSWESA